MSRQASLELVRMAVNAEAAAAGIPLRFLSDARGDWHMRSPAGDAERDAAIWGAERAGGLLGSLAAFLRLTGGPTFDFREAEAQALAERNAQRVAFLDRHRKTKAGQAIQAEEDAADRDGRRLARIVRQGNAVLEPMGVRPLPLARRWLSTEKRGGKPTKSGTMKG
jgi:hypothetical protein